MTVNGRWRENGSRPRTRPLWPQAVDSGPTAHLLQAEQVVLLIVLQGEEGNGRYPVRQRHRD